MVRVQVPAQKIAAAGWKGETFPEGRECFSFSSWRGHRAVAPWAKYPLKSELTDRARKQGVLGC